MHMKKSNAIRLLSVIMVVQRNSRLLVIPERLW